MTKDEALKLALDALEGFIPYLPLKDETQCNRYDKAITAIKDALKTKDEFVAVVISESGANVTHSWWHEPALPIGTKLYTSPQRTWVGLTDEETETLIHRFDGDPHTLLDEVNARLKEKNT